MLPTIIIGAVALAILWPFIRLAFELIRLAGSLALLVASCAIGAVAVGGQWALGLLSACRRHAEKKTEKPAPQATASRDRSPLLPEYSSVR